MGNISKCRSCGLNVVWVKTKGGKIMPVDLFDKITGLQIDEKVDVYDAKIMTSHFATCPDAKKWRKMV